MTAQRYEDVLHDGYGYSVRKTEGERIAEFGNATNLLVCWTMSVKKESTFVTFESSEVGSQVDFFLTVGCNRRLFKDLKVTEGEECTPPTA